MLTLLPVVLSGQFLLIPLPTGSVDDLVDEIAYVLVIEIGTVTCLRKLRLTVMHVLLLLLLLWEFLILLLLLQLIRCWISLGLFIFLVLPTSLGFGRGSTGGS